MVNKADFSVPPQGFGENLLLQELLANYPMELFASLAKLSESNLSLPAKIAQELLSKGHSQGSSKLANLVTLLPSFKDLPPEFVKMLERAGEGGLHSEGKPAASENQSATADLSAKAKKQGEDQKSDPAIKTSPQSLKTGEKSPVGLSTPAMLNTMKEVLTVLHYFAKNLDTVKFDSFDALQKIMDPLIDQLILPAKKNSEGGLESQNRDIPSQEKREIPLTRARNIPIPSLNIRQNPEKPINEHSIQPKPGNANQNHRAAANHFQESSASKLNESSSKNPEHKPSLMEGKPSLSVPLNPIVPDRITLPAAPFSPQNPIFTAPRKEKKKPKDPWERDEELLQEDEDPFA